MIIKSKITFIFQIPEPRAPTKWEEYAARKGIVKKTRAKKVNYIILYLITVPVLVLVNILVLQNIKLRPKCNLSFTRL